MNVISIPLDKIAIGARLRAVDEDYAAMIAASMAEHGQRTPIEVRTADRKGMFRLVAGAHRIRALQLASFGEAQAVVLDVGDDEARLLEIDENLFRRELSALDRAVFLAERKAAYEALHPETRHGGNQGGPSAQYEHTVVPSFAEDTAERLGIGRSTMRKAIALAMRLPPAVRAQIQETRTAEIASELEALARLEGELQVQVANEIAQAGEPVRVADVVARLLKRSPPAEKDLVDRLLALWKRATPAERTRFLGLTSTKTARAA